MRPTGGLKRRHRIGAPALGGALAAALLLASACGHGNRGSSSGDAGVPTGDAAPLDQGGGDGARDASGAPDGGARATGCSLPRLDGDLTRDWDLHLATVSGTLTLGGGGALPNSPTLSTRGNVVFRELDTQDVRLFPVGGAGAASFSGRLFAGTYDVSFETAANPALVGLPPADKTRLASALAVAGNQRVNFDLALVAVTGSVTAGGGALPDSPTLTTRGNLVFRERQSGDARGLSVGATGPGSFSGSLFAGTYDVTFETVSGAALVGLPISAETRVASALVLSGAGASTGAAHVALTYDVGVATVTGQVTAGGAMLPDSPTLTTRGNVLYREHQTGDLRTFAIPATGVSNYAGLLFAGSYDISYQTPSDPALVDLPAASTIRVASAVAVSGATAPVYDLPIANVAGTITANGGRPLPDSPGLTTRGSVRFVERTTGLTNSFAIGATGPGTFAGTLFAGDYDVSFASSSVGAGLVDLPPAGNKRVATALAIGGGPSTVTYDLAVVAVSGTITAGGTDLPASPTLDNRGNVVFRDRETGAAIGLPVGAGGPGAFTGIVFASSYDVTFETVHDAGLIGLPSAAETRLASNLAVNAPAQAPFTWDTRVIAIAGRLTLDGAALPDSPTLTTRGNVVFRDKLSGDIRTLPLAPTGAATVSGIAFAGSYDVSLETTAGAGLVGLPAAAETNLDLGCLPASSCAMDATDVSGTWTFIFRDQVSWVRWTVSLTQTGGALGGRFVAAGGYGGQFDSGLRVGSALTLSSMQNTSTCVLRVDASLLSGCFLSGVGSCAGGLSQSPFVGLR